MNTSANQKWDSLMTERSIKMVYTFRHVETLRLVHATQKFTQHRYHPRNTDNIITDKQMKYSGMLNHKI
jgi:hypothetical protein